MLVVWCVVHWAREGAHMVQVAAQHVQVLYKIALHEHARIAVEAVAYVAFCVEHVKQPAGVGFLGGRENDELCATAKASSAMGKGHVPKMSRDKYLKEFGHLRQEAVHIGSHTHKHVVGGVFQRHREDVVLEKRNAVRQVRPSAKARQAAAITWRRGAWRRRFDRGMHQRFIQIQHQRWFLWCTLGR
jgi:hypothetical protein